MASDESFSRYPNDSTSETGQRPVFSLAESNIQDLQSSGQLRDYGAVLSDLERAPYKCHPKSHDSERSERESRVKRWRIELTAKFGQSRRLRLSPPVYRAHKKIELETGQENLFKILASECMEQLYDDNSDGKFGKTEFLSFSRLHHMNLHWFEAQLAAELADIVHKKNTDRQQMLRVRRMLRKYSAAIGDYERVLAHWKQPLPGELTNFHKSVLPDPFIKHIGSPDKPWDNGYIPLGSSNPWARSLVRRVGAALLGGIALLVPMLIMAIDGATTKNLVTTSVAVVVVAVALACTSLGSWQDVLGITAAYSAVLVVFIGTSTPQVAL